MSSASSTGGWFAADGIFMSVILTYFASIVTQERVLTKGSCPTLGPPPTSVAPIAPAGSHGQAHRADGHRLEHTWTWRLTQKRPKRGSTAARAARSLRKEDMPWVSLSTRSMG